MPSSSGGPNDNTTICVGKWVWKVALQKWVWEGNCQTGIIGGPAAQNRVYIPEPQYPPGTNVPPPPPISEALRRGAGQIPDPQNPATGPVTGPKEETPPPEEECGPAMATEGKYADWRIGNKWQDDLKVPAVGGFGSAPIFTTATRVNDPDPNKASPPVYTQHPYIKYNPDGTVKVWHQGHGPGLVVFHPPQLKDYHWYGDEVLPGASWPTDISKSTLLILNGANRQDGLTAAGNLARNTLAFGLAHRTKNEPVSGVYFDIDRINNAFCMQGTDSTATASDTAIDFKIGGDLRVNGGFTMPEFSAAPNPTAGGDGQFWVKDDEPNTPYFTDDTSVDHQLAYTSDFDEAKAYAYYMGSRGH